MKTAYYNIHIVTGDNNEGYSVGFKTVAGLSEDEIVANAVKAGAILDIDEAKNVDEVNEIYIEDYKALGGDEENDNIEIEQIEIETEKTFKRCQD